MTSVISCEKLTKRYGHQRGVIDVELEVASGEVFGFLGPNGAGKTTTIRLLLDLIHPTQGRAEVLGLDSHRDTVAIQAQTGYLPGELRLYPNLTGGQTLHYLGNLQGSLDWKYVRELAGRLDCDLSRKVADLSTGNKRKLGLIQAFMAKPQLLILDEPTAGLDPLMQREFHALVDEARALGQTVFLSSHVLPEVQRVCDRVAFVREGKIIAFEDVSALTSRSVRELEVVFAEPVSVETFRQLPGVSEVARDGRDARSLRFRVSGELDPLIKALGAHPVIDLRSHEPDLEDVFMTFYSRRDPADEVKEGGHAA